MKISGGSKLEAKLREIASNLESAATLRVGFLSGGTYPDGTSIPMVAATNEFGVPAHGQPPRPFFRRMIAKRSLGWPKGIAAALKDNDYNTKIALAVTGEVIKGQLVQSINELVSPPLAASTIARKGGVTKPLIDTGIMLDSVGVEVE